MDATTARRMFELIEPIGLLPFFADQPNEEMAALGFTNYWDGYFAWRSAPLGKVPPGVVDALFYSFAPGEVARHLPKVWDRTTPEAAFAACERGCTRGLREVLGDDADDPAVGRAADLLLKAATTAPIEGRALFAAHLTTPVPDDPAARLWHAANLLREYRGDGHVAALMVCGVARTEAHVMLALDLGMVPHEFGRIHHLPRPQIDAVVDGMRARGLVGDDGGFTDAGRALKDEVERLTDAAAVPSYQGLSEAELEELIAVAEPISARFSATWAEKMG